MGAVGNHRGTNIAKGKEEIPAQTAHKLLSRWRGIKQRVPRAAAAHILVNGETRALTVDALNAKSPARLSILNGAHFQHA